jgi:hypothetical protein
MAYGRAYKRSLDIENHDVQVPLPAKYKGGINSELYHTCHWT